MRRSATLIKFQAKLLNPAEGGGWLFLRLPQEASDLLPTRSQIWVEGLMDVTPFQACLEPDNNSGHWMKVDASLRDQARVHAGAAVEMEITPMLKEPETDVPEDLAEALSKSPAAMEVWNSTTTAARRDWITWMGQGRKAETRKIRLNKMIDMLEHGKRRVCCYDRAGIASKAFICPTPADE